MGFKKDFNALKKMLISKNNNDNLFSMHSKVYAFTTENISGYYKNINFIDKKILTICSSGDHILNAIFLGCKDIDCFDINIFTKYYMYLKLGAIKVLTYSEFLYFFESENKFSFGLYQKISTSLNEEIKKFWDLVYSNEDIISDIDKIFMNIDYKKTNKIYNLYLKEDNYNTLKNILLNDSININFIQSDFLVIHKKLKDNYNYIFLSNIIDYLPNYYTNNFNSNYIGYIKEYFIKKISCEKIYYCYIYNIENKIIKLNFDITFVKFENNVINKQVDSVGIINLR